MNARCSQVGHVAAIHWMREFRFHAHGLLVFCWFALMTSVQPSASVALQVEQLPMGHLLLMGGGEISPEIRSLFLQLAGGENARIVLIPTGSEDADRPDFIESFLEPWRSHSTQSIVVLHARNRCQTSDSDFLRPLREATGVWISGGVQSRIAERYLGTEVENELQRLLARNGIIAGTSAGAAVMTRVMIADGLRRPVLTQGLDLLHDAIVDQHFSQRFRMPRLVAAIRNFPNHFGVGIDEGTGLLVEGKSGRVLGKGRVRLLSCSAMYPSVSPPLLSRDYSSGETIDLNFWRELVSHTALNEQEIQARNSNRLFPRSRVAPALAYSLSNDYEHLDSRH